MMLTVIIVFALCWLPLYGIYCYFFLTKDHSSATFQFASHVLRPIFQWLSLLSSSLNPLIYIAYSQKYRRAFRQLLVLPCHRRYERIRSVTRTTLRLRLKPHTADGTMRQGRYNGSTKSACDITLSPITILSSLDTPCSRLQRSRTQTMSSF
ncbi:unnamed protein product [Gongylonema pulchrum]|uniref:G_PROTEIN_RECEP_F1_2 domain-containing protein n=1 Tax=Gongylonema pulchrum TaxID=637853 RepID=A0A183E215_9BILA|nr:unnamed protein product [Gongylonema pulchrum]